MNWEIGHWTRSSQPCQRAKVGRHTRSYRPNVILAIFIQTGWIHYHRPMVTSICSRALNSIPSGQNLGYWTIRLRIWSLSPSQHIESHGLESYMTLPPNRDDSSRPNCSKQSPLGSGFLTLRLLHIIHSPMELLRGSIRRWRPN